MRANFDACMPRILQYEGGWSNHKRDPGGVTLEGIIQRVYDGYRDRKGLPRRPLTPQMRGTAEWKAERNEIYWFQYWHAVRGDELPVGVDLFVFDGAVNSGPFQSAKWLQRGLAAAGLYHGEIDGHLGEASMAALQNHPDHDALIADMAARRLGMLQHLDTWDAFGDGWTKRVVNARAIGQAWATGSVGPAPVAAHQERGDAKGYAGDVAQPAVDSGDAVKIGVGSGSAGAIIDSAKEAVAPLAYSSDIVMKIFTALTILSVLAALGALGYSLWASRKAKKARRAIDGDIMAEVPEGQPA